MKRQAAIGGAALSSASPRSVLFRARPVRLAGPHPCRALCGFAALSGSQFRTGLRPQLYLTAWGLYGSVYLLALFLGLVRGHTPLEIGEIMMVSGAAQLVMAPVAALLETRMDARLLTAIGFVLFGLGLFANGFVTPQSDFHDLFWPQILRGLAVMLCILPATRLALEGWAAKDVPDASGLFQPG